jgi:HAD superfamily hydrolase (TIGR01509 family)
MPISPISPIRSSSSAKTVSLEALLWDMDGTLVDTEPLWVDCEKELMAQFGYQWSEEDALHCIGGPMERVELYLKEKSRSDHDPSWFGETLVSMMLERLREGAPLRPGVEDLVNASRQAGMQLALVSASRRAVVDAVLSSLPFDFDFSISASEVQNSKPDPESYLVAAKELASSISSCVVIEDSKVGITAGLASGAMVIGVTQEIFEHESFHGFPDLSLLPFESLLSHHSDWVSRVVLRERS